MTFGDAQITEITCHARGTQFLFPETRTVIDMGGQDTKAIKVGKNGEVLDFCMNDKCAAGSGGFLERAAKYLEVQVEQIGPISIESRAPQSISSVCAVLAESEIINHVSDGKTVPDILRGIHDSLAERSLGQLRRVGLDGELAFIGGVARQAGMVVAAREKWAVPINIPEHPHMVTALGAALLGLRRLERRLAVKAA